jgi:adenine-specific DNA-methyltransferase
MLSLMNGWAEYELKDISDDSKRAEICGVNVDDVRKNVNAIMLAKPLEESRKRAEELLKNGPWPKLYLMKKGKGGLARKTYLSDVGGAPPTNLFEYKDVGHTDEAKKEVLKVFDGQSPFATPKPERLIKRVLEIATDEGDLVMDSFLGSGTTAAVAHKMGRHWIGIEMGDHAKTHCAVRMKKVVDGEQGGISKAVKWNGGGGFRFYELGEPLLDERGQIAESIPYDVLAAHIWWQDTGTGWGGFQTGLTGLSGAKPQTPKNPVNHVNPVKKNLCDSAALREIKSPVLGIHEGVAYALLYNGILHDRSVNGGNVLTRQTLGVIKKDLADAQERVPPKGAAGGSRSCATEYRKLVVYGEWNKLGEERLKDEKIEFRQTPYDVVTRR